MGAILTFLMFFVRRMFVKMLDPFLSDKSHYGSERTLAVFDIGKGLSAVVVATIVISLPSYLKAPPNFLELIFVMLLLTNIVQTLGMYLYADKVKKEGEVKEISRKESQEGAGGRWHPV